MWTVSVAPIWIVPVNSGDVRQRPPGAPPARRDCRVSRPLVGFRLVGPRRRLAVLLLPLLEL